MTDYADISHYQGTPDWDRLKSSHQIDGAIIKAGGGDEGLYTDSQFTRNWKECKRVGLVRGAYWFAAGTEVKAEADKFIAIVKAQGIDPKDILALDLEIGGDYRAWGRYWLDRVEQTFQRKPWIYGNAYFLRDHLQGDPFFKDYPLWLAGYPRYPFVPSPWTEVAAHQYTSSGQLNGITGNVDMSHVYYTPPVPHPPIDEDFSMDPVIFTAHCDGKFPDGTAYQGDAQFYSPDLLRFVWIQSQQEFDDRVQVTVPESNRKRPPVMHQPGAVADIKAFGRPDDQVTLDILGKAYKP